MSYTELSSKKRRQLLDTVIAIHGMICCICAEPIALGSESLQHVKPRSKGGTDDISNLRPAHKRCNFALGDRELDESIIVAGGDAFFWQ